MNIVSTNIKERLASMGYTCVAEDDVAIGFAIGKVENYIQTECNISELPDGLFHVAVDMVCGEFLQAKKATGQLNIGNLDLTGAITSIKEGDTQVSFDSNESDSNKLDLLINSLKNGAKGELVCYRKLRW